jgi:UDP-MurNAc hydroxylase
VDPINCNALYHWPPLVHDIERLAAETDAIYISHVHPDHFDPRTLDAFPKHIPIYIGDYKAKGFRDELRTLGFTVTEVPFQTSHRIDGTDFELAILESDYAESAAYDSSMVVRTPDFTLFNNNDCFLKPEKYGWVAERYDVDYAFLGYSPASYFPICFEYAPAEKERLLADASERRYADFVVNAKLLRAKIAVPFAMGIRFLQEAMLWQNVSFNSPHEAVRRVSVEGIRGEVLCPGDRLMSSGAIERLRAFVTADEEPDAIRSAAALKRAWIEGLVRDEKPAAPGVTLRFRDYMLRLWKNSRDRFPELAKTVIAYRIEGPQGGEFYFDFSRDPGDIYQVGATDKFDMRYTYLDRMLDQKLQDKLDWDELHFSNRLSVCQHRYSPAFYAMIRQDIDSR